MRHIAKQFPTIKPIINENKLLYKVNELCCKRVVTKVNTARVMATTKKLPAKSRKPRKYAENAIKMPMRLPVRTITRETSARPVYLSPKIMGTDN